jgi:hypothetical protein
VKAYIERAIEKLKVDKKLILVYVLLYFTWGMAMNYFGSFMEIAKFTHWWQVITCYILYMIPISLLLRGLPFHAQYAYGLVAMAFLEFGGYALKTSYAFPGNMLDRFFSPQNFSLGMAMFFALYFPVGNWAAGKIYAAIFRRK